MVKVYKTSINDPRLAKNIQAELSELILDSMVTIDLEDCDKVLRVQANRFCSSTVIELLEKKRIKVEIMDW
ncbi:hypothetical protein ORI89_11590 [Sphingobacterium sp. UT-1RO-CII-1]|uniref:hypothetical protein n=1 Tax=Sphingobacterium sp. UT-1RO-CII-1 TaxID=2995225 RepID=UPI00227D3BAE|nr:hypothetical protein [Sphingobacterium sp. UT-1RO-CII-1]MCY4780295.1 hypothetical protein [Sphingobacterium sp. UT-1RO-CII-1]